MAIFLIHPLWILFLKEKNSPKLIYRQNDIIGMKGVNVMSKKVSWKTGGQAKIAIFAVLALICEIGVILLWLDAYTYWNTIKISNKEEMFQFVVEHLEELDQVVWEMNHHYETSDVVTLSKNDRELRTLDNVNELFKNFSVSYITINRTDKRVDISFAYVPKGYDYWGIYYTEDGKPTDCFGGGTELVKQGDTYVQIGNYYRYETEKIVGSWYYYQCVSSGMVLR